MLELQEKAVQALKSLKSLKSVKEEQRFNFSPYIKDSRKRSALCGSSSTPKKPKKSVSWTHIFFCLAKCDQAKVPGTMWEREQLLDAGLGEQKLTFNDLECTAEEYKKVLVRHFPKLSDSGGYELMRCCPNSRNLECISSTALQSPQSTQERVGLCSPYSKRSRCDTT